jgi:hypothetical protein
VTATPSTRMNRPAAVVAKRDTCSLSHRDWRIRNLRPLKAPEVAGGAATLQADTMAPL